MLEVRGVSKTYEHGSGGRRLQVLDDIRFEVGPSEVVCILGPSGCGKTTLLKIIAGLLPADSGEVTLAGEPVRGPGPDKAMVFQGFALLPWLSVLSNIAIGLEAGGVPRAERRERAMALVHQVGLAGFEDKYPGQLSGGMQQRVGLARALVMNPTILLMDEPFGALDAQTRRLMQEELTRLHGEDPKPVLLITHDIEEAVRLGDRIVLLSARPGRVDEVLPVELPRPRPPDLEAHDAFPRTVGLLWKRLREANVLEASG